MVPESFMPHIVEALHSAPQAGHPGKEECLHQARLDYYWPEMGKDINSYIDKCNTCALSKGSAGKPVKILNYPTQQEPWDTLSIDLLKQPTFCEVHQYMLVAIDHISRYSILVPFKEKTANSVATTLIEEVFSKCNTLIVLLSDNGVEFLNNIFSQICK